MAGIEHGYGFAPEQTGLYGNGAIHDDTNHIYTVFIYAKYYTDSQRKSTYFAIFPYEYTIKGE